MVWQKITKNFDKIKGIFLLPGRFISFLKRNLPILAILFTIAAICVGMYSDTDIARKAYKSVYYTRLSQAINNLFHEPNKYIDQVGDQCEFSGKAKVFYLQEDKSLGFESMKNFILDHDYNEEYKEKVKNGEKNIRYIVAYQHAGDPWAQSNPIFHLRPIFFFERTEKNIDLDFETFCLDFKVLNSFLYEIEQHQIKIVEPDQSVTTKIIRIPVKIQEHKLILKGIRLVTSEEALTKNLDNFFTNRVRIFSSIMLLIAGLLDLIVIISFRKSQK